MPSLRSQPVLPEGEALTDLADRVVAVIFLLQVLAVVNAGAGVAQPPGRHPATPQGNI